MKTSRAYGSWTLMVGVSVAGCTAEGVDRDLPNDEDERQLSVLERCLLDDGALEELWSVGNQHGPVTSIAVGDVVVLGAADGSVKQWSVDGDAPDYGVPFSNAGAAVGDLAFTPDGHVVAADAYGQLTEWRMADAAPMRTIALDGTPLTAVGVRPDGARLVVGNEVGELYAIDRGDGGGVRQLTTALWGASSVDFTATGQLFTSGHWYGTPMVERRAAADPVLVIDTWNPRGRNASVRAVALDAAATTLIAAGDGFLAVLSPDDLTAEPGVVADVPGHVAVGAVLLPGGALFATAGEEGTLRVWRTATAELVHSLPIAAPAGLAADRDGTRLFTSGPDGRLHAFGCR
jgi:WD40 repeat protein